VRLRRGRRAWAARLAGHDLFEAAFDPAWYVARHRDVFREGVDPLLHFLGPGIEELRDPSPWVDLSFYRTHIPAPPHGLALLEHLLERGIPAGIRTSPYVDLEWFARATFGRHLQDVGPTEAFRSLIATDGGPDSETSPFVDLDWYRRHRPEIEASRVGPMSFFSALGGSLRLFPHPVWQEDAYISDNEYVRFALGLGKYLHGYEQFCAIGHSEVARGDAALRVRVGDVEHEYSEDLYLTMNPDVVVAIESGEYLSGVSHFFARGHREVAVGQRSLGPASRRAHPRIVSQERISRVAEVLVLLVHFDPDGLLDPHVKAAISTYRSAGFDVCVITINPSVSDLAWLDSQSVAVIDRVQNNPSRDFGAWLAAIETLGSETLDAYSRVVFANDSAYFPVLDPKPFLTALESHEEDLWGATDSLSGGRLHLQSYFISMNRRARDVLIPEMVRRLQRFPSPTKATLIQQFEIGISQYAIDSGLSIGSYLPVSRIEEPAGALSPPDARPVSTLVTTITNQTHHFWRDALEAGLPFLKVELIRDNPAETAISGWEALIPESGCSVQLITDHLRRTRQ